MNIQPGDYIALEGLTDQQVANAIKRGASAGFNFNGVRVSENKFLLFTDTRTIWLLTGSPSILDLSYQTRQLTIEQVLGVQNEVVKQERYLGEDGKDLIDKWAERYSPEEFRLIMFAMMEKYQERLGKKDSIAKECRKIADYANRLALVEETRENESTN